MKCTMPRLSSLCWTACAAGFAMVSGELPMLSRKASTLSARPSGKAMATVSKAWVTHGGAADYYDLFVRTSDDGPRGISVLLADAATPGLTPQPPERKMGLRGSPTAQLVLDDARVDLGSNADRRRR